MSEHGREYQLLLWAFIKDEVEHHLNEAAAKGWRYCDQLPMGILLERSMGQNEKDPPPG